MKYFSMFSGIGGFELGIQKVCPEWECVGHSEIDKYADQVYMNHFKSKNFGNAREINPDDIPDIDMICGGFPCQSFSIAGKRGGIKYDTRGTLFREIVRIAEAKRPSFIFLENVKGLLSSAEGWDFYVIQDNLVQLGYELEWEVLNTKNFGLPQNRERVFIIGRRSGKEGRQKIFPLGRSGQKYNGTVGKDVSFTIDANYHKGTNRIDKGRRQLIADVSHIKQEGKPRFYDESPSLNTAQGGGHMPLVVGYIKGNSKKAERESNAVLDPKGISMTIMAQGGGNTSGRAIFLDQKIRSLIPVECARLQGFPDKWCEGLSDTQQYKCYGNSVSIPVISAIVEKLNETIQT
jgi:DNA (cytosine-5)-methyltransferase 1